MRTITIEDALGRDNGEQIPSIEGKIVWVGPRKDGTGISKTTGEEFTWSHQAAILAVPDSGKDDPNSSIFLDFDGREDVTMYKGHEVRLESYVGKSGMAGILRVRDEYTSKSGELKVTEKLVVKVDPHFLTGSASAGAAAQSDNPEGTTNTSAPTYQPPKVQDDFVPQTMCHMMAAAAQLALTDPQNDGEIKEDFVAENAAMLYRARDKAVDIIRGA